MVIIVHWRFILITNCGVPCKHATTISSSLQVQLAYYLRVATILDYQTVMTDSQHTEPLAHLRLDEISLTDTHVYVTLHKKTTYNALDINLRYRPE